MKIEKELIEYFTIQNKALSTVKWRCVKGLQRCHNDEFQEKHLRAAKNELHELITINQELIKKLKL